MIYYRIDYDFLITSTGLLQIQDMILELKRTGEFIQPNIPDRSPYLNMFYPRYAQNL